MHLHYRYWQNGQKTSTVELGSCFRTVETSTQPSQMPSPPGLRLISLYLRHLGSYSVSNYKIFKDIPTSQLYEFDKLFKHSQPQFPVLQVTLFLSSLEGFVSSKRHDPHKTFSIVLSAAYLYFGLVHLPLSVSSGA